MRTKEKSQERREQTNSSFQSPTGNWTSMFISASFLFGGCQTFFPHAAKKCEHLIITNEEK
jgi:hypothetical protein